MTDEEKSHLEEFAKLESFIYSEYQNLLILDIEAKKEHRPLTNEYDKSIIILKELLKEEKKILDYYSKCSQECLKAFNYIYIIMLNRHTSEIDPIISLSYNNDESFIRNRITLLLLYINRSQNGEGQKKLSTRLKDIDYSIFALVESRLIKNGNNIADDLQRFFIEAKYHLPFITPVIENEVISSKFTKINKDNLLIDDTIKALIRQILIIKFCFYIAILNSDGNIDDINRKKYLIVYYLEAILAFFNKEEKESIRFDCVKAIKENEIELSNDCSVLIEEIFTYENTCDKEKGNTI